jgi:formylglycine-generating enzyme required for sulfatase activity
MQPTVVRYTALDGEQVHYQGRSRRGSQDWLHFPVSGISWQDVLAYVGWLQRTGRVPGARPCTELEWERAARGADERTFPHGEKLAADDANFDQTYGRLPSAFGPDEVGSHPASRSPFELDDMAGNVWELVRGTRTPGEFVIKGGGWYIDGAVAVVYNRENVEVNTENPLIGARICATFGSPKGALHK